MVPTSSDIGAILARHGIVRGPEGYAWGDLTALVAQRGWHCHISPARTPKLGNHFQALIWSDLHIKPGQTAARRVSAKGRGPTEEEALADTLGRMLIRCEAKGEQG